MDNNSVETRNYKSLAEYRRETKCNESYTNLRFVTWRRKYKYRMKCNMRYTSVLWLH